ncbi:hypothetical protein LZ32DRAFT_610321 [Colletotrichum eremochloae]|nr:hypothetical protein LZ32DRAFT_610321 [Colletotrichum eremochloae]
MPVLHKPPFATSTTRGITRSMGSVLPWGFLIWIWKVFAKKGSVPRRGLRCPEKFWPNAALRPDPWMQSSFRPRRSPQGPKDEQAFLGGRVEC